MELLAQGLANIVSALFGGIAVTGTIARTATNVRAGARTPVAGLLHALFLLLFLLVLAPLAQYLPLAVLAGILVTVCWNMAEKAEFIALLKKPRSAGVLLTTFAGTLVFDLTTGIVAGWLLSWASGAAAGLWARRAG
jgi:SulP family sulfate permease